ncbi:four-helix bundle copper-binding protein [Orenia metallireducens]|nr:four-helix bundle copper-binding protein [Orenia metallireducens]
MHRDLTRLLTTIQDCEMICEDMTSYVMRRPNFQTRIRQLELLRDCADICALTAKYIARDSYFARDIAELCADICMACSRECAKFPDQPSQHCSRVCYNCAQECERFAMARDARFYS